jgi:hypothetical protein
VKILIHCGSGNTDRPGRWHGINPIFTNLGEALIDLGHDVTMMLHDAARNACNANTRIKLKISNTVDVTFIKGLNPDLGITWNGASNGDRIFVDTVGKDKMMFGELGFFGHYDKTCYFDRCGVNTRFSMIGEEISSSFPIKDCDETVDELISRYKKPSLLTDPFIFVPLQDETDTQITQFCPFETMDEFMHYVYDIYRFDDRLIVYKQHPRARSKITISDPRVVAVTEDVHHYLPYADCVFGLNSTVMIETLMYHSRLVTYGAGISSRHFENDIQRRNFIALMDERQFKWSDLRNPNIVQNSHPFDKVLK